MTVSPFLNFTLLLEVATPRHDEVPQLRELKPGHTVACHWAEDIAAERVAPLDAAAV